MPEQIPYSQEAALTLASMANEIFDQIQEVGPVHESYKELNTEFLTLQAMAGVVLGPPRRVEREEQVEKRLDMTALQLINELIRSGVQLPSDSALLVRLGTVMHREDNPSLRELMVMGYDNLKTMRNLGPRGRNILEAARKATIPDVTWSPSLDGGYATQFYSHLHEIPARVIDRDLIDLSWVKDKAGINSIGGFLNLPDDVLFTHLKKVYNSEAYPSLEHGSEAALTERIRYLRERSLRFSTEFEHAQTRR